MAPAIAPPRPGIRIVFGAAGMTGPGKADLPERNDRCGAIATAARCSTTARRGPAQP
jgi:molybdate transport system regulatory protein